MIMNIEKTISEHAVSDILTPMLESQDRIVTEDVAPLFDQATGLDTPPASGTVTTTIEESRSVITAIIRKAWTATLTMLGGASVLSYIAAAYTYLRTRLQGNETYGIPDRRSEISASSPLAANLALLNDRKISNGSATNDGIPDGMSLARLLCDTSAANSVTEIVDDNYGWEWAYAFPWTRFSNVRKASFGFRSWTGNFVSNMPQMEELDLPYFETITMINGTPFISNIGVEELVIPITSYTNYYGAFISGCQKLRRLYFPNIKSIRLTNSVCNAMIYSPILEELYMPEIESVYSYEEQQDGNGIINTCPEIKKIVFGDITSWNIRGFDKVSRAPKLIHFEMRSANVSINLSYWEASEALDASRTDLIEQGSTAENNLQQFLLNFKTYIAERLTDNGSGKTLTLSQAVFSEIWDSQGQPQVKGDGLDDLRADIHRIIRTDKQWAVNKA